MSLEGELWEEAEEKLYGYGAGCAHPSVEWVKCPHCGAEPGHLCFDDHGPKLGRHYRRCYAYADLRAEWRRIGLEDEPRRGRRARR